MKLFKRNIISLLNTIMSILSVVVIIIIGAKLIGVINDNLMKECVNKTGEVPIRVCDYQIPIINKPFACYNTMINCDIVNNETITEQVMVNLDGGR